MACEPCRVLNGFYNISERNIHNLKELPENLCFQVPLLHDSSRQNAKHRCFVLSSSL